MFSLSIFVFSNTANADDKITPKNPASAPAIPDATRHVVFQAGQMNHKPWDHKASYSVKINFNAAIFTPLLSFNQNYKILPGLFKDWYWNAKTKSYIFTIDSSYTYDGHTPVQPIEIEYSILKTSITPRPDTNPIFFHDILGIEKLQRGQKFVSGMCDGIRILAKDKIEIRLKNGNPAFLYSLGSLAPPVSPIQDFDSDLMSFKGIPRGTGQYRIVWSDPHSSLVRLELKSLRNLHKSKQPRTIDFINSGEPKKNRIHLGTGGNISHLRGNADYKIVTGRIPNAIQVLDFNYGNRYGRSKLFREAISYALDRKKILRDYPDSKETHELIPSRFYGRTEKKFEHNPEKGRKILLDYFPEIATNSVEFKGIFHGSIRDGMLPAYLQEIQKQLEAIGVKVTFEARDWTIFKEQDFDTTFSIYGLVTSYIDSLTPFAIYLQRAPFNHHSDSSDWDASRIYEAALNADNLNKRAVAIRKLSEHFQKEFRQLPIQERYPVFVYDQRIQDIGLNDLFFAFDFNKIKMNSVAQD